MESGIFNDGGMFFRSSVDPFNFSSLISSISHIQPLIQSRNVPRPADQTHHNEHTKVLKAYQA
jgi:hypothetical protein